MVEKANTVILQLGTTPRYLDPRCHEALYEVDVGVNEVRVRLDGAVVGEGDAGSREVQMSRIYASSQANRTRR